MPALEGEVVREPESAEQERTLPWRQAVDFRDGRIAVEETVANKPSLDVLHCAEHPRISGRQEADERKHQQAGIRILRPVRTERRR